MRRFLSIILVFILSACCIIAISSCKNNDPNDSEIIESIESDNQTDTDTETESDSESTTNSDSESTTDSSDSESDTQDTEKDIAPGTDNDSGWGEYNEI